jgi:hypothetical protein
MDAERFDQLARRLAESLPRRQLLRRAAGTLAGVVLAGPAARAGVGAITCTVGIECDGRCCTDNFECVGEAPNRICSAPCEGGASRCGTGCCDGICCDGGINCCPAGSTCCPKTIGGYACCPSGQECVPVGDGTNHCFGCQEGATQCGVANCCAPGFVCQEGPNPGDGTCIACPSGATKCGGKNCCTADESCSEDGECVDACPVGVASRQDGGRRSRRREVTAEADCEPPPPPCPDGTVKCGNACVLECKPGRIMNVDTCACECEGQPCGAECCPADQECSFQGGDGLSPRCCLTGKSCGQYCKDDPRIQCCKAGPWGVGRACDAPARFCCGEGCCLRGEERCVRGKCKKRRRRRR